MRVFKTLSITVSYDTLPPGHSWAKIAAVLAGTQEAIIAAAQDGAFKVEGSCVVEGIGPSKSTDTVQ